MRNKTKKSDLKLVGNLLSEAVFKVNKNIEFLEWYSIDENEIEVKVETQFGINKQNPANGKLILKVEIFKEDFILQEKPFYCFVEMEFLFRDDTDEYTEDETVINKYGLNMISISYPYIRAYISTLSSISGIDQIHIPTINVYDTFENQSE